jgi:hypothetical protein
MASAKQFSFVLNPVKSKKNATVSFKDSTRNITCVIKDNAIELTTNKGTYSLVKHPHINQFECITGKYKVRVSIKDNVCKLWYW